MLAGRTTALTIYRTPAQRETLRAWQRSPTIPAGLARRAGMVVLLEQGMTLTAIATVVDTTANAVQLEDCSMTYRLINQNGTLALNTCTEGAKATQALGSGTLATPRAISAADPGQVTLTADTSLTLTTGFIRLRYTAQILGNQAMGVQ